MILCHNIPWKDGNFNIKKNVYLIDNNQVWVGNIEYGVRKSLYQSAQTNNLQSLIVHQSNIWLLDSECSKILRPTMPLPPVRNIFI